MSLTPCTFLSWARQVTAKITPFQAAACRGQADVMELLLDRGAELNGRDMVGETALMKAAYGGHLDAVTLLVERGADKKLRGKVRRLGLARRSATCKPPLETPLEIMTNHCSSNILRVPRAARPVSFRAADSVLKLCVPSRRFSYFAEGFL